MSKVAWYAPGDEGGPAVFAETEQEAIVLAAKEIGADPSEIDEVKRWPQLDYMAEEGREPTMREWLRAGGTLACVGCDMTVYSEEEGHFIEDDLAFCSHACLVQFEAIASKAEEAALARRAAGGDGEGG